MGVSNILVDAVLDRGKVILALWVVAVLILVPPAFKMLESMGEGSMPSLTRTASPRRRPG